MLSLKSLAAAAERGASRRGASYLPGLPREAQGEKLPENEKENTRGLGVMPLRCPKPLRREYRVQAHLSNICWRNITADTDPSQEYHVKKTEYNAAQTWFRRPFAESPPPEQPLRRPLFSFRHKSPEKQHTKTQAKQEPAHITNTD